MDEANIVYPIRTGRPRIIAINIAIGMLPPGHEDSTNGKV
jgi:hypothetical protein